MSKSNIIRRGVPAATALLMALVLTACGGGGGNPGSAGSTGGSGNTGGTGGSGTVTVGAPASVQFVVAAPADKSIVIKGQGGNGRVETATLTFKVVDTNGNPLANQTVNFTLDPVGAASLNTTSGKTGADGTVVAAVSSGTSPTTLRVIATLPGTASAANGNKDLSTQSDTITVTTGVATQNSFSISSDIFNVEGWNIDSSPAKPAAHIQVLLADAFGNPVADGTPIVFQTNLGSVGSADRGGCTTVNGGCSVDFRAQNPRVATPGQPATPCNSGGGTDGKGAGVVADFTRRGVATICASSTNGSKILFDRIELFMSGSVVDHVYMDSATNELVSAGATDLGTMAAGATRTFWLQLDDVNHNPMPAGSKVAVTGAQGVSGGAVTPATVPNVYVNKDPNAISQGSWHQVSITATTPSNCSGAQAANFNVSVTTPGVSTTTGSAAGPTTTDIPFKLSVTCP
jgi:hypothetical protein